MFIIAFHRGVLPGLIAPVVLGLMATCSVQAHAAGNVLTQLITEVLAVHPSVVAGQAQGRAAQFDVDAARWQFFPTASVGVETVDAQRGDPSYAGDKRVRTLRLQQPLWTNGRLTAGLNRAQAGAEVSEATLADVRQQLALQVLQLYGDWYAAHLKAGALDKSLQEHARLKDQVGRRIAQGLASEVDLALASGRLDGVSAELTAVRVQRRMASARLSALLRRPLSETDLATQTVAPHTFPLSLAPDEPEAQAIARSPAISRARMQVKAQAAVVEERQADLYPEVYLRFERQQGNYSNSALPSANHWFLGFSSRLGAGLSTYAAGQGAKAQLEAAQADVEAQEVAVRTQVLTDQAQAEQQASRIAALQSSQVAASQVFDSYMRQYLAGRKAWQEVMNASRELAQGDVQLAEAQASLVVITWRMAIYLQGLDATLTQGDTP
jgi:outer membrane protein, adhesin transport system